MSYGHFGNANAFMQCFISFHTRQHNFYERTTRCTNEKTTKTNSFFFLYPICVQHAS